MRSIFVVNNTISNIIKPKIFYPYHYGQVEEVTDLERLKKELVGVTDVRIFPME